MAGRGTAQGRWDLLVASEEENREENLTDYCCVTELSAAALLAFEVL